MSYPVKTNWAPLDKLASADLDNIGTMLNTLLGFATQATAAATLTLTATSAFEQEFTGTTPGQAVQMPVTSTLPAIGWSSKISNKSTQTIAVNSSGGNPIFTVPAGTDWLFTCNAITGTTAASWSNSYAGASAVPGGGKVLQVVQGSTTTSTTLGSATYTDTTLTATITPTLNTSKILVLVAQGGIVINSGSAANAVSLRLLRGVTDIGDVLNIGLHSAGNLTLSASMNVLDSPATTSATTYKTQFSNPGAASYVGVQDSSSLSTIILLEIGA